MLAWVIHIKHLILMQAGVKGGANANEDTVTMTAIYNAIYYNCVDSIIHHKDS